MSEVSEFLALILKLKLGKPENFILLAKLSKSVNNTLFKIVQFI